MTRNCFSLQELQSKLALVDDKMNEISSVVLIENSEEALSSLSSIRLSVLGKKGILPSLLSLLPLLSEEDRPIGGKLINDAKRAITGVLDNVERDLKVNLVNSRMSEDFIDVTLPPRVPSVGSFHPVLEVLDRAIDVLLSMGFSVRYGSEVDTTENAFDVLNFSKFHPARDMQDTFYLQDGIVLRPQTSSAQIPILREGKLPIRVIVPGKCFRNEEISSRSLSVFHQVEGLYVDKDVTLET